MQTKNAIKHIFITKEIIQTMNSDKKNSRNA